MSGVKTILGVFGLLMMLMGGIWVAQGLNMSWAPQSFMTNDINWTYRGAGFAGAGLALLIVSLINHGWRNLLGGVGAMIAIIGAIWIAQGTGLLPGMGMSGSSEWTMRGAIAFGVGVVLALIGSLRRASAA